MSFLGRECVSFKSLFAFSKKQYVQTFDIMEYQSNESNRVVSASLRSRLVCMRQSYSEIEKTTISLTSLVNERGSAQVQKISTSPHLLCFQIRVRGKSLSLYLGRGGDYLGLWIDEKYLPAEYRVKKDKTVEYLKKEVKGLSIVSLKLNKEKSYVEFNLKSKNKDKNLYWVYGDDGAGFILHDLHKEKSFSSFSGKISNEVIGEVIDNFVGNKSWKAENTHSTLEDYFRNLEKMVSAQKFVKKKINKIKKKIDHIETDIERLDESQKQKNKIISDQLPLDEDFKIKGLKVKFEKNLGHYQRRDKVLTKLKDWDKARKLQEGRLQESKSELEGVESGEIRSNVENVKVVKVNWTKGKSSTSETKTSKKAESKGYDLLVFEDGTQVGVGKNASGNDELRKNWGKKDDYWFHIEGEKGSHLILKGALKPDHFDLIGSILRDYSGYSGLEIPIIYSTVGKIKGLSGKRGAVTISKPRYFQSVYRDNWREIIANSVY